MGLGDSKEGSETTLTTNVVQDKGMIDLVLVDYEGERGNNMAMWESENYFSVTDSFYNFFSVRKAVTISLSTVSILVNSFLFVHLLTDRETIKWHVFPILLQILCDILGPGAANILHEVFFDERNYFSLFKTRLSVGFDFMDFFLLNRLTSSIELNSVYACVLTFLRNYLNEYITVACVCATAFIRYWFVCHPTDRLSNKFFPRSAIFIISIVIIQLGALGIDFAFNSQYGDAFLEHDKTPLATLLLSVVETQSTSRYQLQYCSKTMIILYSKITS